MRNQPGNTIAEYALILALVAVIAMPVVTFMGGMLEQSYRNNEPMSKADDLFALLDAKTPSGGSGPEMVETSASSGIKAQPSGQPVGNVYFNYNPATGLVEVLLPNGSATGSTTTSADGTELLAKNLANLLSTYQNDLTPVQQDKLNQLSSLGYKLAAEERKLLQAYPELATGASIDLNVFTGKLDSTIYYDYLDFKSMYEMLASQLNGTDPQTVQIKQVLDTNAALISQLAYKNFIEVQTRPENYGGETGMIGPAKAGVVSGNIDITAITISETPVVTEAA
jgi:Flp pilus assembly pilin Flp